MMGLFAGIMGIKSLMIARRNDEAGAPVTGGNSSDPGPNHQHRSTDEQVPCPRCAEPDMLYGMCLACGYRSPH